jgi:hypothetical protein
MKNEKKAFREVRGAVGSREGAVGSQHLVGNRMFAALQEAGNAMNVNVNPIVGSDTEFIDTHGKRMRTKPNQHLISIIATPAQRAELVEKAKALITAAKLEKK